MVNQNPDNRRRPIHDRVLSALCEHPLSSRRHVELFLGCSDGWSRRGLARLLKRGLVKRYDAHQPWVYTRALYAPTPAGLEEAARQVGMDAFDFSRYKGLHSARLERMALTMRRVFQLRTMLLWLARPSTASRGAANGANAIWRPMAWDVEVAQFFSTKERSDWIPFHGAALFARTLGGENPETRWIPAVIELDQRLVSVEAERDRFARFVAAQDDPRFWKKEKEFQFPILLIVAQDEFRLQEYYALLRALALSRQLPMPRAYLTTIRDMLQLRDDSGLSIWYSTVSSRELPLLFDLEGNRRTLPDPVPWRRLPLVMATSKEPVLTRSVPKEPVLSLAKDNLGVISPEYPFQSESDASNEPHQLAGLAFALLPLEKRLLDEIAAHPVLAQKDLALLLQASERRVRPALAKLKGHALIDGQRERFLLAPRGERYLALSAGFGNAVRRYARARGWGRGWQVLLDHWEHTRAENDFFLHLAAIAQSRGHTLLWLSELEGRLYYEAGRRRHSFMPDGRGTYLAGKRAYAFAIEIDRTRASQEKIRRKFVEYAACVNSYVLRKEGIEFLRLLLVTSSWERAETLRRTALQVGGGVPIFITTFDRYRASGADAAIWLRSDQASTESAADTPKVHCFECFNSRSPPRQEH